MKPETETPQQTDARRGQSSQPASLRALLFYCVCCVLLAACSLLLCGYRAGPQVNHDQQWPVFFQLLDPELYRHDDLTRIFRHAPGWFYHILSRVCGRESFPGTLLFLHLLSQLGTISALVFGALDLRARHFLAPLLPGLLFCGLSEPLAGGAPLHWDYVTHTSFAAPLALWALALRRHVPIAGLLAGCAVAIHPLVGMACWIALGGVIAARKLMVKSLLALLPGLILSAAVLTPELFASGARGPVPDFWRQWVLLLYPMHYYPLSTNWFFTLRLLAAYTLFWELTTEQRELRFAGLALAAWIALGVLGADVLQLPAWIKLQTARGAALLMPLLFWALVRHYFATGGEVRLLIRRIILGGLMVHLLYFSALRQQGGLFLKLFTVDFAILCVAHCYYARRPAGKSRLPETGPAGLLFKNFLLALGVWPFCIGLAEYLIKSLHGPFFMLQILYFGNAAGVCAFMFLAALLLTLAEAGSERWARFMRRFDCPRRWTALLIVYLLCLTLYQVTRRIEQGDGLLIVADAKPHAPAMDWVRSHTHPDDVFLVYGLALDHFRIRAERATIVDAGSFRAIYLDPAYAERLRELQTRLRIEGLPVYGGAFRWGLSPQQALRAAAELNADYLILPAAASMQVAPVYADHELRIYPVARNESPVD